MKNSLFYWSVWVLAGFGLTLSGQPNNITTFLRVEKIPGLNFGLAFSETNDKGVKMVQEAFDYCPRLDKACLALLVGGVAHMVKTCTLEVGTCINPRSEEHTSELQ
jgi:hypothetical protein